MRQNYDPQEVKRIEADQIRLLGDYQPRNRGDWDEAVGLELWKAWIRTPQDTRIVTYCFPTINAVLVANLSRLAQLGLEQQEVFNQLVLALIPSLTKYQPAKGELFPYLLWCLRFRVLDLISKRRMQTVPIEEDWDQPGDDSAKHELCDLLGFILKDRKRTGPTGKSILNAIYLVLTDQRLVLLDQRTILAHVCKRCGICIEIVEPYYNRLLERFTQHSRCRNDH